LARKLKGSAQRAEYKTRSYNAHGNLKENIVDFNNYRKPTKQKVTLLPKNLAQETYIDALENPNIDIVFACGYAGSGKTYLATLYAIQCLKNGTADKIVITRPNIAVDDKDIGYLPGDILKKMSPWTRPILDVLEEYYSVKEITGMIEENIIELVPLAYIRGRTFKNSVVIVDEAQNTTRNSMLSALTRIGEGSKMIITGDTKQSDRGHENGLSDFLKRFTNIKRIAVCHFDRKSVERHPIIGDILRLYGEE
jgi:phosphate starvation-inducible protein PhoH and related proteins